MRPGRVVSVIAGALLASTTTGPGPRVERATAAPALAPEPRVRATARPTTDERVDAPSIAAGVVAAETRAALAHDLVEWLAFERHPPTALLHADQLGELAPWLRPADAARLLELARGDALESRRRAAFVALGHVRPATAAHGAALLAAFAARPTFTSRLGLIEALLSLRHAGAPIDETLELALGARLDPPPFDELCVTAETTSTETTTRSDRP